jgi:methionine salvage enolase-phosphatase E1
MLKDSAEAVRDAVTRRLEAGRDMELHYDHPILLLQHMIWHEGYHHGQIKLALKLAGRPMSDDEAGPVTTNWVTKYESGSISRRELLAAIGAAPAAAARPEVGLVKQLNHVTVLVERVPSYSGA